MIDIKKTRNNFQKFPILKQRCDPVSVVKTQTAIKCTPQTTTTVKKSKSQATDSKITTTTVTTTKPIYSTKAAKVTANPSKSNDIATNSNPVRAANQPFFLVTEFLDKNFLKAECELAHAQVYKPAGTTTKNSINKTILPVVNDNRRLINSYSDRICSTNNNLVSACRWNFYLNRWAQFSNLTAA